MWSILCKALASRLVCLLSSSKFITLFAENLFLQISSSLSFFWRGKFQNRVLKLPFFNPLCKCNQVDLELPKKLWFFTVLTVGWAQFQKKLLTAGMRWTLTEVRWLERRVTLFNCFINFFSVWAHPSDPTFVGFDTPSSFLFDFF